MYFATLNVLIENLEGLSTLEPNKNSKNKGS